LAEDFAQDTLIAALQQWPESGIPDNPGAWLMVSAKHRAIDHFRRNPWRERELLLDRARTSAAASARLQ
jgi:predicted RNA polymerase sigma factor